MGITLSNAAGSADGQYSDLVESPCTGSAKSLMLAPAAMEPLVPALNAGRAQFGVDVDLHEQLH